DRAVYGHARGHPDLTPVTRDVGRSADAVGAVGEAVPLRQQAAHHGLHLQVPAVLLREAAQGGLERPAVRADRVGDVVDVDLLDGPQGDGLEDAIAGRARCAGSAVNSAESTPVRRTADARLQIAHHARGGVATEGPKHSFFAFAH